MPQRLGDLLLVLCRTCNEGTYELPELVGEDGKTECPMHSDIEADFSSDPDDAALDEWADSQARMRDAA